MSFAHTRAGLLDIKITFQCNNLCRFCIAGDKRRKWPDPCAADLIKVLESNRPACGTVIFSGGEPTVRPDLPDLIRAARACGYKHVMVQSNGRRMAYPGYADALLDAGADQFSISLHGHKAALHEYLTARPGSFGETVLGIRNLAGCGAHVATNTVITRSACHSLPDIARLIAHLGAAQMQFAYPHLDGTARANVQSIAPRMELMMPALARAVDAAGDVPVLTEGIPACILGPYADHASECAPLRLRIADSSTDKIIPDFKKHRTETLRAKGPDCPACRLFNACEGPWADYPEFFGWEEFRPVTVGS